MVVTVKGINLDVDAEVSTDETWPDRLVACGVVLREVLCADDKVVRGGGEDWHHDPVDILPLLDPAVIAELETEIRRRALASHAETFARW